MKSSSATDKVSEFLEEERRYNEEHDIWPSHNKIIDRLLACGESLEAVWSEILKKAPNYQPRGTIWPCWKFMVQAIFEIPAGWSPEKINDARDALRRIADLNADIADKARDLAELMRRRNNLAERYGISLPEDDDPMDLMGRAAFLTEQMNPQLYIHMGYKFEYEILPKLAPVRGRYDWKYWPHTVGLIEAIAEVQDIDEPVSTDRHTAAALERQKPSVRDFMRAFDSHWAEVQDFCSTGFELSAASYAALVNAVLGIEGVAPEDVRNHRSRERSRKRLEHIN